jgi:energy-converting hydrogenase Eha subunit H
MEIIISIPIILAYIYYIIRKKRVQPTDSQEMTNTQKALSFFSFVILAFILGGAWGFANGAAYKLYSFPKEHSLVFHLASLLIFIVALEILDFFKIKALKTILKKTRYNIADD